MADGKVGQLAAQMVEMRVVLRVVAMAEMTDLMWVEQ